MSKLARTLILAATVAALNLAGMTAIAHAHSQRRPRQHPAPCSWQLELSLATTRPPPSSSGPRTGTTTSRPPAVAAGGTEGPDAGSTPPSGNCPTGGPTTTRPPRCRRPNSRPGCKRRTAPTPRPSRLPRCPSPRCSLPGRAGSRCCSLSPLARWRRRWRLVAGLALLAVRRANRRSSSRAGDLTSSHSRHSMGLPRPPAAPSPCRQPAFAKAVRRSGAHTRRCLPR